ncbi:MAG: serine hydrolase domain-containing protein [Acidimicrobiales bacterium]
MSTTEAATPLVPLPAQPEGVAWPTDEWPTGALPTGVDISAVIDRAFDSNGPLAETHALVLVHRGRLVFERYADETTAATTMISWSMAKSVVHAVIGMLVGDGLIEIDKPAAVLEWQGADDPRSAITLDHMLAMRDGLDFCEDYVDDKVSHVIEMLFGSGQGDVAGFAASRPPAHPPGDVFNYSSGTSNIVSRLAGEVIGGGVDGMQAFLDARLFGPLGMTSATARFDDAGTFIASSFVYATAQDFARFGYLYLRDGMWDGRRLLPEGWVDHGRTFRSTDPTNGRQYGAHWWVRGDEFGTFWANGYEGQSIMIVPALDLVMVRLGKTDATHADELMRFRADVVEAFAEA